MIITTLPSSHKTELIQRMFAHPLVDGARYNVGVRCLHDARTALSTVQRYAEQYGKKLWVDLKGRQLRCTKWGDPTYGDIELSHPFEVDLPATIIFRGGDQSNIIAIDGNQIAVDPDPRGAVGPGQAVNVIGNNLRILGPYLTETDREYIAVAKALGIHDYMLSFVESEADIEEVKAIDPEARCVLKIESLPGLDYVASEYRGEHQLMAARDDLLINIGNNKAQILPALELIVQKDPDAIAASHILTSLEDGRVNQSDLSDLRLLQLIGYKHIMLSDGVSHYCFPEAMRELRRFYGVYDG